MADENTGETRPKPEGDVINLVVKDQAGGEVHFKVGHLRGFGGYDYAAVANAAVGLHALVPAC